MASNLSSWTFQSERWVNTTTANDQSVPNIASFHDGSSVIVWMSMGQDGSGAGVYGRRLDASGNPVGGEFRINTTTAGDQAMPTVLANSDGSFVVYWQTGTNPNVDIVGQRYDAAGNASGSEFTVNSTIAGSQIWPTVSPLAGGGHLVSWFTMNADGTVQSINARRFDAAGAAVGQDFLVGTVGGGVGVNWSPTITGLADGGFVALWKKPDGSGTGIFGQRFDATGAMQGSVFQVNATTAYDQQLPSAVALPDGGFVVTWTSANQDGGGNGIFGQRYNAAGGKVGGEFLVNTATAANQYDSRMASLPDGGFLVMYTAGDNQDGSGAGIFGQRYDANAVRVGGEFRLTDTTAGNQYQQAMAVRDDGSIVTAWASPDGSSQGIQSRIIAPVLPGILPSGERWVNTTTANDQSVPNIASFHDGSSVIVWMSMGQDGSGAGVYGRRLDASGNPVGGEFRINTTTAGDQAMPTVLANSDGSFVVYWQTGTNPNVDIVGQRYDAAGNASGSEFTVNSTIAGSQIWPTVSPLAGGGHLVSWFTMNADGTVQSINARRFDAAGAAVGQDFLVGTVGGGVGVNWSPTITGLADGGFVALWKKPDGSGTGIFGQRFDATGAMQGSVFQVNATTAYDQQLPSAVALPDGGFVVTWTSANQDGGGNGIFGQRYNAAGGKVGGEFLVNTATAANQHDSRMASLPDGGFLVMYTAGDNQDGSGAGIFGQRYDANAVRVGGEFLLTDTTAGNQYQQAMAVRDDGSIVTAWASPDGSSQGIQSRVLKTAFPYDTLYGSLGNDTLVAGISRTRIFGLDGDDLLQGNGSSDYLDGGNGNDTIVGGAGDVFIGGAGVDTLIFDSPTALTLDVGGSGFEVVYGNVGNDRLWTSLSGPLTAFGGAGNDTLIGGTGNDTLDGGSGTDSLVGGIGDDVYVVDNVSDVVTELANEGTDEVRTTLNAYTLGANVENLTFIGSGAFTGTGNGLANILQGGAGNDTLDGGAGIDTLRGGAGNDTYLVSDIGDVIVENAGEGTDEVRTGLSSYTLAANIENLTYTGTAAFTGIGNTGNNLIIGGAGNDSLTGDAGNDTLDGGAGADTLIGGTGNDTYIVDNAGDVVTELAGQGTDTVRTSLASYTLVANVENLVYTGTGPVTFTGNALNNSLTGGAGADLLTGLDGNDTLNGGAGADTLIGGTGNDTYVVDNVGDVLVELPDEGIDTVQSSISHTLLADFENLTLTGSAALTGTGNALNNLLTGNGAANLLTGLEGDDTLNGGGGADTLIGGTGNDLYVVDNAGDVVTELVGEGIDTVNASINWTLGANIENLTLTGSAAISATGNELNNVLTGNSGANLLDGGLGADSMAGGAGNDVYIVDNAGDVVTELAGQGTDEVRTSLSSYLLGANIEALTYTGTGDFAGTGNALDNLLTGDLGNDTLSGGDGADTLDGGAGSNLLIGGAGNDVYLVGGLGDQVVELAGEGIDEVRTALTGYTLTDGVETLTYTGVAAFAGTGNALDNLIAGGAGADTLDGGLGADTLIGGLGDDVYVVDSVGDTVIEGADAGIDEVRTTLSAFTLGDNVERLLFQGGGDAVGIGNGLDNWLTGNAGNDTLDGAAGNDTLLGGLGTDMLTGGSGADLFVFASGDGQDTITDFDAAQGDRIGLAAGQSYSVDTNANGDAVIVYGTSDIVTLVGIQPAAVSSTWFVTL
ncbi:beta strand repeat-containing protein [Azospirillum sp. B510]|uniref:beta strand repeat-containing protein n=1 Tax=Azospirillum sp. (strain B510) TaxID=137722 RepID=UPI0011D0A244|nr:calcium-binding protein [Azospirillum sp. B510]